MDHRKWERMTEADMEALAQLYDKRGSAIVVDRRPFDGAERSRCHENARLYCEMHRDFQVVTGWLFMGISGTDTVLLFAHSVAENGDGEMLDVTPQNDERVTLRFLRDSSDFIRETIAKGIGYYQWPPLSHDNPPSIWG
jgi:hypothetical protein